MTQRVDRDRVAALIHLDIIMRNIPSGAPIDEAELAERMSVSRTPIREIVHFLGGKGLLVQDQARGFRTPVFGIAEIGNVFQVARVIFPEVFALAGLARRDQNLAAIAAAADALEETAQGPSDAGLIAHHRSFVMACAAATQNAIYIDMMAGLTDRTTMIRSDVRKMAAPDLHAGMEAAMLTNSERLRELVEAGDAEGLRATALERVELMREFVLSTLGLSEVGGPAAAGGGGGAAPAGGGGGAAPAGSDDYNGVPV